MSDTKHFIPDNSALGTVLSRRTYLAQTGLTVSLLASGCAGFRDDSPDSAFDPIERRQQLGGAEPVAIEAEPEREYTYLPDEDRVRITYGSGRSQSMPFEEWGTMRAKFQAADHVGTLLQQESLLGDGISTGVGEVSLDSLVDATPPAGTTPIEYRSAESAPIISHEHLYDRDGTLVTEPDAAFETVVAATPRAVTVTMLFPEREYTTTVPVVCKRTWLQYD
mgnify:CR=1 FL=1